MKLKDFLERAKNLDPELELFESYDGHASQILDFRLLSEEHYECLWGPNWSSGKPVTKGIMFSTWLLPDDVKG